MEGFKTRPTVGTWYTGWQKQHLADSLWYYPVSCGMCRNLYKQTTMHHMFQSQASPICPTPSLCRKRPLCTRIAKSLPGRRINTDTWICAFSSSPLQSLLFNPALLRTLLSFDSSSLSTFLPNTLSCFPRYHCETVLIHFLPESMFTYRCVFCVAGYV